MTGDWLVWWRREESARATLLCFGQAGAGAGGFRPWVRWLPEGVNLAAIRAPGRESRVREEPVRSMEHYAASVADALEREDLSGHLTLFGQCSGAFVAFEVARELVRRGGHAVRRLVACSQTAPSLGRPGPPADEPLEETLRRLGGTAPEILADETLMRLVLPAFSADVEVLRGYGFSPAEPLDARIDAIVADRDEQVDLDDVAPWALETRAGFRVHVLQADHFFTGDAWRTLASHVGNLAAELD